MTIQRYVRLSRWLSNRSEIARKKRGRGAKAAHHAPVVDLPGTHSPQQRHPVGNVVAAINSALIAQRGTFERVDR